MSARIKVKLDPRLRDELDACGLPWELGRGRRHLKLFVAGRLAAVIPHGTGKTEDRRADNNVLAAVRRLVRELLAQKQMQVQVKQMNHTYPADTHKRVEGELDVEAMPNL
jgi:hypothetical protein